VSASSSVMFALSLGVPVHGLRAPYLVADIAGELVEAEPRLVCLLCSG